MVANQRYITPFTYVKLGCDPELFFTKEGKIIGSERVLPKKGLLVEGADYDYDYDYDSPECGNIVRDGVQVELNPYPNTCRALLGNEIAEAFRTLRNEICKDGIKLSMAQTIEVSKAEMGKLSDECKVFGCAPSINVYKNYQRIKVNPAKYRKRSAGGHLHFGFEGKKYDYQKMVQVLDILLGNTCVLIDRDTGNVERRKHYGKAGEHRLPKHGLEYRVLSNFWLKDYKLFSFVMGAARLAIDLTALSSKKGFNDVWGNRYDIDDLTKELFSLVKTKDIQAAINQNDLDLAKENYSRIRQFLSEITRAEYHNGYYSLHRDWLDEFDFFANKVQSDGLEYWFPKDPVETWCSMYEGHGSGWESFCASTIRQKRKEECAVNG